jgi:hypothetical protein
MGGTMSDAILLLSTLYPPESYLWIGERYDEGIMGSTIRTVKEWIDHFRNGGKSGPHIIPNPMTGAEGTTQEGKPSFRSDNTVGDYRFCVVEFDDIGRDDQIRFWSAAKLPIAALIDSGGKSIHGWLDVRKLAQVETFDQDNEHKKTPLRPNPNAARRGCKLQKPIKIIAITRTFQDRKRSISATTLVELRRETNKMLNEFEHQARTADGQINRYTAVMIIGGAAIDEHFERLKSVGWAVKNWIPLLAWLIEFFGAPGTYKSFIALDIALSIATGRDWHGHPVKQCRVVYIPAEGQSGILKRAKAWQAYHGVSSADLDLFTILPRPCLIDQPGELDSLIEALRVLPDPPVGFIFIDTLARSMTGDENSTSDMGAVVNACAKLSEETNHAQIALVHHTGKDEGRGPRGAIALTGATDVLINVQKPYDRAAIIRCDRQKDDEPPTDMAFNMAIQGTGHFNEDGEELSSLVPVYDPFTLAATAKRPQFQGANRIALNALDKTIRDHGQPPSAELLDSIPEEAWPAVVAHEDEWRKAAYDLGISDGKPGAKKTAFSRARIALMDKEAVSCFNGFYWKR